MIYGRLLDHTIWRFMRWIDRLCSPYDAAFMAEVNRRRKEREVSS